MIAPHSGARRESRLVKSGDVGVKSRKTELSDQCPPHTVQEGRSIPQSGGGSPADHTAAMTTGVRCLTRLGGVAGRCLAVLSRATVR